MYVHAHKLSRMHHHINAAGTLARMKPYQLILGLMAQKGIAGALPLAKAANVPKKQPQVHRWLNGEVAEPKRATVEPIAKYFEVPVEAMYDEREATRIARDRGIPDPPPTVEKRPRSRRASPVDELIKQVELLTKSERERLGLALAEMSAPFAAPGSDFAAKHASNPSGPGFKAKAPAPGQKRSGVVPRES